MTDISPEPTPQSVVALMDRLLGNDARTIIPHWGTGIFYLAAELGEDAATGYFTEKYRISQQRGFSSYDGDFKRMLAMELGAEIRLTYLIDQRLRAAGIDPATL